MTSGIAGVGMLVEALGQQHVRAQVHRPAPELRQPLALDPDVLDVLGRRADRESAGSPVERQPDRVAAAGLGS